MMFEYRHTESNTSIRRIYVCRECMHWMVTKELGQIRDEEDHRSAQRNDALEWMLDQALMEE